MEENELRERVAEKITTYRKLCGMTQFELAEKINYSDKSVSKWERGDGMPDTFVLYQLAELFGVTVDALLYDDVSQPVVSPAAEAAHDRLRRLTKTLLFVGLVWLCGTVLFFLINLINNIFSFNISNPELLFLYCFPVSCIVLIIFTKLWWSPLSCFFSVTGLVWTAPLSIYCTFREYDTKNMFLICAVLQMLVIIWFIMRFYHPKKKNQ